MNVTDGTRPAETTEGRKMGNGNGNGRWRIAISVSGVVAAFAMAVSIGAQWVRFTDHLSPGSGQHMTLQQENRLIDERVELHLRPMRVELREMNKKLDRLLEQDMKEHRDSP